MPEINLFLESQLLGQDNFIHIRAWKELKSEKPKNTNELPLYLHLTDNISFNFKMRK